jgi:SHS2 domain-containing protein
MPYVYVEDIAIADIAFRAWSDTLEEVFRDAAGFTLQGRVAGERIDPAKHELEADVKGVTLHQLQVAPTAEGWEAMVVLDV